MADCAQLIQQSISTVNQYLLQSERDTFVMMCFFSEILRDSQRISEFFNLMYRDVGDTGSFPPPFPTFSFLLQDL